MKKNVMIRIDADIAENAKEIGLNISKVCENALIRSIKALAREYGSNESIAISKRADGGPSRIRTGDYRDVNAVS